MSSQVYEKLPGLRRSDLGNRLLGIGQIVEHVGDLVHLAALMPRCGITLLQLRPEAQRLIAPPPAAPRDRQPPLLHRQQQLAPALLGFANPVLDCQKTLLTALVHANHHQGAQPLILGTQPAVDAVGPQIHPALMAQGGLRAAVSRPQLQV